MRRCYRPSERLPTRWFEAAKDLPDAWDAGLPKGHFLLRRSLEVSEATALPRVRMRYALLQGDEITLARAAFQVLQAEPEHVKQASLPAWQYRTWAFFTRTLRPKLLVAGQLFRHDVESVFWNDCMSPFDAFSWYRDTIAEAAGKSGAVAVLVKELPAALVPHFLHGAPEYILLRNDISMRLAIPAEWQSMADYEQSLKHKYAQRFRKVRRSWEAIRIAEMSAGEVREHAATIFSLYSQVTDNQPVRMGFLSEQFIPVLKAAYPDKLKVWGMWEGDQMIAFASGWVNEESFDMFYIGFDYSRNTTLNLYFNILFFAIEQAIMLKKPLLILGRTALEAKARVGCHPEYLNTFLYIRNRYLRKIVASLQSRLGEAGNEWEQRHPFKG